MKGMVFSEFLRMIENRDGHDAVDAVIEAAGTATDGAYTSVGTYPPAEMVALVGAYSRFSGRPVPEILNAYGRYLFARLAKGHGALLAECTDAFALLERLDNHIHVEVAKLYPDAELPRFAIRRHDERSISLVYDSSRNLADLAEGLLWGCLEHFHTSGAAVVRETLADGRVEFRVTRT